MTTVVLKPLIHNGTENIAILAANETSLNFAIRTLPQVKWSQSGKCWYIPLDEKNSVALIAKSLSALVQVDSTAIQEYLKQKKEIAKMYVENPGAQHSGNIRVFKVSSPAWRISQENLQELQKFVELLKLKAYSGSTIITYRNEFLQLLLLLKQRPVSGLSTDQVKRYMVYAMEKQGISENTAHSRINALKFYFEQVLHKERFFWAIPRPKKPLRLPKVLAEKEISRLFNAVSFLKHKVILFTAYSAGLRVSEIVNLQWKHIDKGRGQILIEQAKGKKDRYVTLSPVLEDILVAYYRKAKVKPIKYVFESEVAGEPYSIRSAQAVFQQAKKRAGIKKDVSFHCLRHSFATHLLEKGTDIRFIQELLGHFSIKTTTRYLHVAREKLVVIESPFDSLWKQGGINWDG